MNHTPLTELKHLLPPEYHPLPVPNYPPKRFYSPKTFTPAGSTNPYADCPDCAETFADHAEWAGTAPRTFSKPVRLDVITIHHESNNIHYWAGICTTCGSILWKHT